LPSSVCDGKREASRSQEIQSPTANAQQLLPILRI
jgi:hypothetical protein